VTDELIRRYAELSRGGAGLIVTGYAFVSPEGRGLPRQLGSHRDELVEGLARLASAIKEGGARAVLQIAHAGGQTESEWIGHQIPVAPSFLSHPQYAEPPREIYREEIARLIKAFAQSARRAREAGFDAVQIHAAHGYLVSQFLSPGTNFRTDRYGGDLQGRYRSLQEIVTAVQWATGHDFPVFVKMNGADFTPGGFEIHEACRVAEWLCQRGVSLIEVSGGTRGSGTLGAIRPNLEPGKDEAYFRDQAAAIKSRIPCPVALVGGLRSLETLEDLLLLGAADLFSLSRPLIREPDLPRRWESGDRAPARCDSCNGCFGPARKGEGARCVVEEGEIAG
jgi:2,4-dienoyl-CoA reductase-like NADH-dependent reductase (Old Yellow Enzyme family)